MLMTIANVTCASVKSIHFPLHGRMSVAVEELIKGLAWEALRTGNSLGSLS